MAHRPFQYFDLTGYAERFNGKLQDELLKGEIFYTLKDVQVLTKQ